MAKPFDPPPSYHAFTSNPSKTSRYNWDPSYYTSDRVPIKTIEVLAETQMNSMMSHMTKDHKNDPSLLVHPRHDGMAQLKF